MRWPLLLVLLLTVPVPAQQITPHLDFHAGPVNSAILKVGTARLAVYSAKERAETVLLTHHRRDVTEVNRAAVRLGSTLVAPQAEEALLRRPQVFWDEFTRKRFHDYDQQSTKILAEALPVARWVQNGDTVQWHDHTFRVLSTPGYTRGAVSYLTNIDGQRIAFTGDLIYGDGHILDLYSLQDAIPAAQVRGYHGYAARLADVVSSLKRIAASRPDLLIPARGPIIREPQQAIAKLIDRAERLYASYLSTNALHWYFKRNRMEICGKRVLGEDAEVELMPYSHHEAMPEWVWHHSTTRLLIAEDGHAFMLDCGSLRVIEEVKKLIESGKVRKIDGIFVTHHHDDHTDMVAAAGWEFDCPVYCLPQYEDILRNPDAFHIAAMTDNPIPQAKAKQHGEVMKWKEFELQFLYFPGQTLYHGALRVQRRDERPILFIGDAFAPSGMDDYCLLNRNLVHDDAGYFRCLRILREQKEPFWLVNEHIPFVFSYTSQELDFLERRYRERRDILRELFPWDDPNYGIDEQWAVCYPYGRVVQPGDVTVSVRITNHSPQPRRFHVRFHGHSGVLTDNKEHSTSLLQPGEIATVSTKASVPHAARNYLVTADVRSGEMHFRHWCETLLTVD